MRYLDVRRTAHRGSALSPLEARAWSGLLRAHAEVVRDVTSDLRAAHDLDLTSFDVLRAVAAAPDGRIRMGMLAAAVNVTPAGVSGVVDRLTRAGLVERVHCAGDGRVTYAAVTGAGLRQLRLAEQTYGDAVRRRCTSRIDTAELELLCRLGERVAGDGRPS